MVFTKPFFMGFRSSSPDPIPCRSGSCQTHQRPLMIYCTSCADSLCDECLTKGGHRGHGLARFKDVLQKQIEAVTRRSKHLMSSLKKQSDVKTNMAKAKAHAEEMIEQTKVNLEKQYQELQELMEHNRQHAFRLLLAQKESLLLGLDTLALQDEQNQQMIVYIEQELQQLKKNACYLDGDSAAALLNVFLLQNKSRSFCFLTSVKTMEDFYKSFKKQMCVNNKRLKGLENSVTQIVQKSKEFLTRPWEFAENITFDEMSLTGNLKISVDKTTLCCATSAPQKEYTKCSKDAVGTILAAQSFTAGCHYWEVEVKDLTGWTVGVVDQDWKKRRLEKSLGEDKTSWVLQLDDNMLFAVHNDEIEIVREPDHFERLGIFLDFSKGLLRFFSVDTGCVLHTFFVKFKTAIYPVFSIKEKSSAMSLTLCKLVPDVDSLYEEAQDEVVTAV
ncbi:tripartite motif-containing protein 14-like [Arapaima gigas]